MAQISSASETVLNPFGGDTHWQKADGRWNVSSMVRLQHGAVLCAPSAGRCCVPLIPFLAQDLFGLNGRAICNVKIQCALGDDEVLATDRTRALLQGAIRLLCTYRASLRVTCDFSTTVAWLLQCFETGPVDFNSEVRRFLRLATPSEADTSSAVDSECSRWIGHGHR
jgi:hypothetical protein